MNAIDGRQAQVGIFIVIAAIVIILGVVTFSLSNSGIPLFSDQKPSHDVKTFIDSCLEETSEEAIHQVGAHGGWLYHPPMTFTQRDKPEQFNQRAEGIDFLEKAEIPYWYYYDDSSESFQYNIPDYASPSQYSLRSQVNRYVEENILECIGDFQQFEDFLNIEDEPEELETSVEFREDTAYIEMNYPVEVVNEANNNTESLQSYRVDVENKLWIPYYLARDITVAEAETSFVEERVLQFINPYQSSSTRNLLPPFYDFKATYDFRPWDVQEVEDLTKKIISSHVGKIQFTNTDYTPTQTEEEVQFSEFARSLNTVYTKDYLSRQSLIREDRPNIFNKYQNYEVRPNFHPFFPFFFSLSPSMGDVILLPRPEAIINFLPFFFTEYTAVYEMSFPVVFDIAPNSLNDDFSFNLAIEANIDHNTPLSQNRDLNFTPENLAADRSLICDPPQFISENVTLNISDPINNGNREVDGPRIGVDDAIITFDCKGLATCYVGETDINGPSVTNNITQVSVRLPVSCDPGTLEIYKFGHKKLTFENLDPQVDKPINLGEVTMPSTKELPANIKLISPDSGQYSEGRALSGNQEAFVIFEHQDTQSATKVLEITPDNQNDLSIELMPGNYSVEGFVIYNDEIVIPSERICYQDGLFSEECEELPEISLDSWVRGGIQVETFEVDTQRLINAEELNIPLIDMGIPGSYSSLRSNSERLGRLEGLSQAKKPYFTLKDRIRGID